MCISSGKGQNSTFTMIFVTHSGKDEPAQQTGMKALYFLPHVILDYFVLLGKLMSPLIVPESWDGICWRTARGRNRRGRRTMFLLLPFLPAWPWITWQQPQVWAHLHGFRRLTLSHRCSIFLSPFHFAIWEMIAQTHSCWASSNSLGPFGLSFPTSPGSLG